MPVQVLRGGTDEIINHVVEILRRYESDHPEAMIDLYRQNSVSIRVRIVDPGFQGMSRKQRNDMVWNYLEALPEETQGDVSMLVLLAPSERARSFSNMEFEDPVPSML